MCSHVGSRESRVVHAEVEESQVHRLPCHVIAAGAGGGGVPQKI
jgi:hypothetical protein